MGFTNAAIIGIDSLLQFGGTQQPFGFRHGAFAMHPLRPNGLTQGLFAGSRHETMRTPVQSV